MLVLENQPTTQKKSDVQGFMIDSGPKLSPEHDRGEGPTLLMSIHPLIVAKCSQNGQTKIDKNRQKLFLALNSTGDLASYIPGAGEFVFCDHIWAWKVASYWK